VPARTIARELGVDYLVRGSVRRAGARARISAQLVRCHDGHTVWAERFDRTLEDLFAVQAEVSNRIVDALQVKLRPAESALLDRAPARNQEAYSFYLRGRALDLEDRRETNQRAIECYKQAIQLDPDFALAHAALAQSYVHQITSWWAGIEVADLARPHVRRALEIDPELPEGHLAMALIYRLESDAQGVLTEIGRAQSLDPANRQLTAWVAKSLMALGRPEEAVVMLEQAGRIHPDDYSLLSALADCYDMLHRRDDLQRALVRIREILVKTLEREPDNVRARSLLGIALAQCGEPDAALVQIERTIAAAPDDARVRYNAACALAQMGRSDGALAELRHAAQMLPNYLSDWPRHDPDLASLHGHPEFIRMFGSGPSA
jgi:adenylate cyclase